MSEFLRRHTGSQGRSDAGVAVEACDLSNQFPALFEFLTRGSWDPQTPRTTGTFLICVDSGVWKGWLNDRDGQRAAWLSSRSLTGLLGAAEAGLRQDALEWRANEIRPAGRGQRRT